MQQYGKIYKPKIKIADNMSLEKARPDDGLATKDWVCWECEESVPADGTFFTKETVDKFLTDHQGCDRDPYQDFPLGE